MRNRTESINRRSFARLALTITGAGFASPSVMAAPRGPVSLFDGKTLNGWILLENTIYRVSRYDISDTGIFVAKIDRGTDPVSGFVRGALTERLRNDLPTYAAGTAQANVTLPALVNELNQLLTGPSIYDIARFSGITLRRETKRLLSQKVHGLALAHLNKLLLEDAYPADLVRNPTPGWSVKDGAMASTGAGRGVIYTTQDYTRYRLTLTDAACLRQSRSSGVLPYFLRADETRRDSA